MRNQEVIRQWRVLHALESSRHGTTIPALADELNVTTRTIRRDLAALQEAGFPLFDERDDEGRVRWRLDGQVLKGLETGFTLQELCALYLSRNLLEAVGATPFQRDLTLAFRRLEKLLTPRMRQFLDRLPGVLVAKRGPRAAAAERIGRYRGQAAGGDAAQPRGDDDVSLRLQRGDARLPRPSVPAGVRAGRPLPAGVRPRVQGHPDVRRGSHPVGLAREADVRSEGEWWRRGVRQLAGRQHRTRRESGDRVRTAGCAFCAGAGLARVAAAAGGRRRDARPFDERVSRLGPAQLDPELGPVRARADAGGAGQRTASGPAGGH